MRSSDPHTPTHSTVRAFIHSFIHREMKRQTSGGRRPGPLRVSAVGVVFTATVALAASVASGFVLEIKNDAEECVYSVRMTTYDARRDWDRSMRDEIG